MRGQALDEQHGLRRVLERAFEGEVHVLVLANEVQAPEVVDVFRDAGHQRDQHVVLVEGDAVALGPPGARRRTRRCRAGRPAQLGPATPKLAREGGGDEGDVQLGRRVHRGAPRRLAMAHEATEQLKVGGLGVAEGQLEPVHDGQHVHGRDRRGRFEDVRRKRGPHAGRLGTHQQRAEFVGDGREA